MQRLIDTGLTVFFLATMVAPGSAKPSLHLKFAPMLATPIAAIQPTAIAAVDQPIAAKIRSDRDRPAL